MNSHEDSFRSCLDAHARYVPGGLPEQIEEDYGIPYEQILKMASNEGAYGAPPAALRAIPAELDRLSYYPSRPYDNLKRAVAQHHDVEFSRVILGHGSEALISTIPSLYIEPGDEVIVGDPAYTLHEIVSSIAGAVVRRVPLRDWQFDLDAILSHATERTKIVWISSPNNPTGTIVYKDELERFMDELPETTAVVLDQAYGEFVNDPDYADGIDLVRSGRPNLIVLRTFSKAWGLAGLRVGYGICSQSIADRIDRCRQPFNLSRLCSVAGAACLTESLDWLADTVAKIQVGRDYLTGELERLGCDTIPSQANFVLADMHCDTQKLMDALMAQGIIVRPAAPWGLTTYVRTTVSTPEGNDRCIAAMEAYLAEHGDAMRLLLESE